MFYQPPIATAGSLDYCIKCANPDQTYVCRIVSEGGNSRGQQFLCIMNIAKDYNHDSCGATTQSNACSGTLVQYEVSGLAPPPSATGEEMDNSPSSIPNNPEPTSTDQSNGQPKTLVEFTKQTTKATKSGLQSAGKTTGNAIKNTGHVIKNTGKSIGTFTNKVGNNILGAAGTTLKCVTSLFSKCNSD